MRTGNIDGASRHLAATLPEFQPEALAPFALTASGDLAEPSGRVVITRQPVAPHLLLVLDGRPHTRTDRLGDARDRVLNWLAAQRHTEAIAPLECGPVVNVSDVNRKRRLTGQPSIRACCR